MKKILLITILLIMLCYPVYAQFGTGAFGGNSGNIDIYDVVPDINLQPSLLGINDTGDINWYDSFLLDNDAINWESLNDNIQPEGINWTAINTYTEDWVLTATTGGDVEWKVSGAGISTYNDIMDPDDNSTISFSGYTNEWTTTEAGSDFFTITNSGNPGDVSLFVLEATGNPTDGTLLELIATDTDIEIITSPNFSVSQEGVVSAVSYLGDGSALTDVSASGAYNDIQDADDHASLAFTTYTNTWVTNNTSSDFFTIKNSGAFGDVSLMKLEATANATNGTMLEIVNTDADVDSIIAPAFSLTNGGVMSLYGSGSGKITVKGDGNPGIVFGAETADPCGDELEGFCFYNSTDHVLCFCDDSGDDLQVGVGSTTPCFN